MRPELLDPEFLIAYLREHTKFDANLVENIINEWKAYKATGLEPDEITRMKSLLQGGEYKPSPEWLRLCELAEAERDGRCVVLPCKVEHLQKMLDGLTSGSSVDAGETYTTGYLYGWKNGRAELLRYILGMPDGGTREAAEAALEAQK